MTTQRVHVAMRMSGVALLRLMNCTKSGENIHTKIIRSIQAAGTIDALVSLHEKLEKHSHASAYKITECNVIATKNFIPKAEDAFLFKEVEVVSGSAISSDTPYDRFEQRAVDEQKWIVG